MKPICDWHMSNWALIPTVVVGGGHNGVFRYGWVYIWWLRGRLGIHL